MFEREGSTILDDVTLHVAPGERWAVLGANGSGKSTLLRIAAAYEHPSRGTVSLLGETIGRHRYPTTLIEYCYRLTVLG